MRQAENKILFIIILLYYIFDCTYRSYRSDGKRKNGNNSNRGEFYGIFPIIISIYYVIFIIIYTHKRARFRTTYNVIAAVYTLHCRNIVRVSIKCNSTSFLHKNSILNKEKIDLRHASTAIF